MPAGDAAQQASSLTREAFEIAHSRPEARLVAVKTAAALLPRLTSSTEEPINRDVLTQSWMNLAFSAQVPRSARLSALDTFFEVGAQTDPEWTRGWALKLQDPAGRAGAFNELSRVAERTDWRKANEYALQAQRAARQETELTQKARALVFVAYRFTELGTEGQEEAIREASSQVRLIQTPAVRDNLLTELVGAASRYHLPLARQIAASISDANLKKLAEARVNIAEVSQTTITTRSKERVTALATAAAPYDVRAIPILLQLPPDPAVVKALSEALPAIYPSAKPNLDVSLLARMWEYSKTAPESAYRDQLQSRLARLMVLQDLWRGRDWGKQLSWKGGRIQVGAFLKEVLQYRQSQLKAGALQDIAKRNPARALGEARTLEPAARVEALLLLAGQILG